MSRNLSSWGTFTCCLGISWLLWSSSSLIAAEGLASQNEGIKVAHCLAGCPQAAANPTRLLVRSTHALAYSEERQAADWLAYKIQAASLGVASSLSRQFIEDSEWEVSDEKAKLRAEYEAEAESRGFKRAGLVPLQSVAGTPYWYEAKLLSATTLRSQSLERGAWSGLEWSLRNAVNRIGALYVVTGPLYSSEIESSGVPSGFFKLIAHEDGRLSAFKFDQDLAVHVHHCDSRTTLEKIEELSGLKFFPERRANAREGGSAATLDTQLGCR